MPLFDTDRRPPPKEAAGLAKEGLGRGPERVLAEMVKRGLGEEHLRAAAALCLELDKPEAR
jgi:hypothetical protein